MDARVYQYRDNTGLEVDAVVDAGMGRWAAFEVKLGTGRIDSAAASLLRFGSCPKRSWRFPEGGRESWWLPGT